MRAGQSRRHSRFLPPTDTRNYLRSAQEPDDPGKVGRSAAFLDVSRSLTGRAWRRRPADALAVRDHQLRLGLSEPLAWAPMESGEDALRRVREKGDRQMTQTE